MQPIQQQLMQAFTLLQQGQAAEAHKIAVDACRASPNSPDGLHLLALCQKDLGDFSGADNSFQKAIKYAPTDPQILTNYGNYLLKQNRASEAIKSYQSAIKAAPNFDNAFMGLGSAALTIGDANLAIAAYTHLAKKHDSVSQVWQGLGSAFRLAKRLEDAETALLKSTECDPQNAAAWVNLGVIQRMLGHLEVATSSLNRAEQAGFNGPELLDARASILLDLGETSQSFAAFENLTKSFPGYLAGHEAFARIGWEYAPETDPLSQMQSVVEEQPSNFPLQLSYMRLLVENEEWEKVLTHVVNLRKSFDHPALEANKANALAGLGDYAGADKLFQKVSTALPGEPSIRNAYARLLLRTGRPEEAAGQLEAAINVNFADQMAWAYLGTCWRLMGDEREDWLHGYNEYIAALNIDIPDEFSSEASFCEALKAALLPMHGASQEPIDQSLRNGTQTPGHLFGHPQGQIRQARDAITGAIAKYQAALATDDTHPFLARSSPEFRYQGAWSVRLRASGFHVNHVHQDGWLSSAFYVALPPSVGQDDDDKSGYIQFGQPPLDLGLDLEPRRYIKPQIGKLAVFPSYTWHGTVPFADETPRITMAYDVVPKR